MVQRECHDLDSGAEFFGDDLASYRNSSISCFLGQMLFMLRNQQYQITEGTYITLNDCRNRQHDTDYDKHRPLGQPTHRIIFIANIFMLPASNCQQQSTQQFTCYSQVLSTTTLQYMYINTYIHQNILCYPCLVAPVCLLFSHFYA